jgi:hypothetical protein
MDLRNGRRVAQMKRDCTGHCGIHDHSEPKQGRPDQALACTSRRHLLRIGFASAAVGVVGGGAMEFAMARPAFAQSKLSPEAALQVLMDGNKRFVERRLTFYEEDLAILKQNTAEKQEPFASVLSCADSRVPVELIFDQASGMCSSTASPATSRRQKLSPVSNTALRFSGRGYSWCWVTRPVALLKHRSRPRQCLGRSARSIDISDQRSMWLTAMLRGRSRPTPKFKRSSSATPHP